MPSVVWRDPALGVGVVSVIPVLDGGVGIRLEILLLQGFIASHLDEACRLMKKKNYYV
jgi:hypothetical protein